MIDACDSLVVQESLLKDRYFVSGRGIGSDSGIAKQYKNPAQDFLNEKHISGLFVVRKSELFSFYWFKQNQLRDHEKW